MDTPILLAVISTAGVLITGLASVAVAMITNRRESKNAADDAIDEASKQQLSVKDERIALRDEQIRLREAQLEECNRKYEAAQEELRVVLLELEETKARIRRLNDE